MLYVVGIGLTFFLVLLLIGKRGKTYADYLLTLWLALIGVHLLLFYLRQSGQFPQLLGIEIPYPLLHGPLLYLYTRALIRKPEFGSGFRSVELLHFVPALVSLSYVVPFLMLPVEKKQYVIDHQGVGYEIFSQINFIAISISGFTYVALSLWALHDHRKSILDQFSSTDRINLNWLRYLIYGIGTIWLVVLLPNEEILFTVIVIFIVCLGYFGLRQTGTFVSVPSVSGGQASASEAGSISEEKQKYQRSGLTADRALVVQRQLTDLMALEKPYTNPELTLQELAAQLNVPANHLSQVINELEQKNFYDFVNDFRIKEFQRQVADPGSKHLTLMGIASNCGFGSKSSFIRSFKKTTGYSPSDFVKSVQS